MTDSYDYYTPEQVAQIQRAIERRVQQGMSEEAAAEEVADELPQELGQQPPNPPQPQVSQFANRFIPERQEAGELGEIAPGQGFSTENLVNRGLQMPPEEVAQPNLMQDTGVNPILQAAGSHEVTHFRRRLGRDIGIGLLIGSFTLALVVWAVVHVVRTNQAVAMAVHLPIPVKVLPAAVRTARFTAGGSGTVQPDTTIVVTARDAARVLQVPVDLGDVVKKDDVLALLDERVFAATLEGAKAAALYADNQLKRMEALLKQGYSSPADTEKARSDAVAAREALVQAETDLSNTKITSPAVAVVLSRTVNPGENTAINQQLFQLGTIENVMMVAEISEDQIGFVTLGMRGEAGTNAFPGQTFVGKVVKIAADEIATTRTFGVYIRIANKDLRLKPGMTGYARIIADRTALAVISTALMNPVGDHATVFVVDQKNVARVRQVRCGLMAEGLTEIKDGLQEGELVVTVGQQELHDGDRVRANLSGPWTNK